ncbi:MAG: hypothetical protein ACYTAN_14875 [Planctomycetota bacterium]|jgi:hypothetical protein
MLYAAGRYMNLLEVRPSLVTLTPVTVSPGTDSNYSIDELTDGRPAHVWKCSADAQWYVQGDLNQSGNGDLENWASPTQIANPWIEDIVGGGTGSVDREGTTVHAGTYSAKLTKGTSTSVGFYQDIVARAGERRYMTAWGYASSGTCRFRIQNLSTGNWLTSSATWSASVSDIGTVAAASWNEVSKSYQVEDLDTCQSQTPTLRYFAMTNDGTVFADDMYDWPRFNAAIVCGHNLGPRNTVALKSDDNAAFSSATTVDSTTAKLPSFFLYDSTGSAERYLRVDTDQTTNTAVPYIGELVVCWLETASRDASADSTFEVAYDDPQERHETRTGDTWTYDLLIEPRRALKMGFKLPTATEYGEHRDMIRRCRGGLYPLVVVPVDAEDLVVYGLLDSSWQATRLFKSYWEDELVVAELPPPVPIG